LEDEGKREKENECDIKAIGKLPDKQKRSYLCHRWEAKKTKRSLRKKGKITASSKIASVIDCGVHSRVACRLGNVGCAFHHLLCHVFIDVQEV
jgi:hypothetical protein